MTFTLNRECARPGCGETFIPKRVDQKYHSPECKQIATGNQARDTRRVQARQKQACAICGGPFLAGDPRQERCRDCAEITEINGIAVEDTPVSPLPAGSVLLDAGRFEVSEIDTGYKLLVKSDDGTVTPFLIRNIAFPGGNLGQSSIISSLGTTQRAVSASGAINAPGPRQFIGVDGEGQAFPDGSHRYVLLGVGDEQREWPEGVTDVSEVFAFLYEQFEQAPNAVFAGFYLGYDFNMWFRLLPRDRSSMLLTKAGQAARIRICKKCAQRKRRCDHHLSPHPVEYRGWQFDILAGKRFRLRPKRCECKTATCPCEDQAPWMYINDAGPFFQSSLMKAINPRNWKDSPVVTPDEYETLEQGKGNRATAQLGDEMKFYNRLENEILARLLTRLDNGLEDMGVRLNKKQWFGPGQAAQAWMRQGNKLDATMEAVRHYPSRLLEALKGSYYGGWFEIPAHGIIPGNTWEYDINSAYPCIIARLPCLCGTWKHGKGLPSGRLSHDWLYKDSCKAPGRKLRLVRVTVEGRDKYLGPVPKRHASGRVLRANSIGWYWEHELSAARKAGLISEVTYHEWWDYTPCDHAAPLVSIRELYLKRQNPSVGKDSAKGKAYKLVYNSVYGKTAQSEGAPVFGNPVYASLITSGCRTMILQAIATHPQKSAAVVMVATDGVYFLDRHPGLDERISERIGEWSREEKRNLTLFKPGVYWDDSTRETIEKGDTPQFKARGINAKDFGKSLSEVDDIFHKWNTEAPSCHNDWPRVEFHSSFTQISVLQAVEWTAGEKDPVIRNARYRRDAGRVMEGKPLIQDSFPESKRHPFMTRDENGVWRSEWYRGLAPSESYPYSKDFGIVANEWNDYQTPEGPVVMQFKESLGL